jgi:dTDP-4-dehydrorhamnose 3,5-epimerase-like enzyme
MTPSTSTIDDVLLFSFRQYFDVGTLVPIEMEDLPFEMKRIFYVYGVNNMIRGQHAHRVCQQALVCLNGSVTVTCEDGKDSKTVVLDNPSKALYIPAGIWASQIYDSPETVLLVICSDKYDLDEYIKNKPEFISLKHG